MVDMSKVKEKMLEVTLPEFFKQARALGLDLRGQSNRESNLQKILEKVSEMKPKEAISVLAPVFREMAEASGALTSRSEPAPAPTAASEDEEGDDVETAAVKETKETKVAKAPAKAPAKEPSKVAKKQNGHKKATGEAANTEVPAKKVVADITFPQERLDKIVQASTKTSETEQTMGAKAAFQFYGKHYSEIQDIFEGLAAEIAEARERKEEIPKIPTFDEYMQTSGFYEKLDRSDQRLRKDAIIFKACQVEGKIPENVLARLVIVKTSRAEAVAALPKPKEAIMKGILVDGKMTPLEKLTKKQVEDAVRVLTGRADKGVSASASRSSKKLKDVPKLLDPIIAAYPKLKSAKPTAEMVKEPGLKKRLQETLAGAKKFITWLEETMGELFPAKS